ncbi:MAG: HDIG domain-containing protein [Nitrospira sp.]|nr:HDIG domain-containing protein [bacterium]MBL7050363.1 HDIG domain-containing protein [Nitrospira sp.]
MKKNNFQKKKKPAPLLNRNNLTKTGFLILFVTVIVSSIVTGNKFTPNAIAAITLLTALLLIILYKDFIRYRPDIKQDYKLMFLIGTLLSANFLIGRSFYYVLEGFTQFIGTVDPSLLIYAIPLATGSMLAALLIDIHTAIVFTVISSLLAGLWLNSPLYSIYVFASGLTAAFGIIRCKKRSAIWRAGLAISMVSLLTALIITLYKGDILSISMLYTAGAAVISGIIVATLVSALLPLFEHLFKLTTDISLLELLDLNQPLMRELLVEAPGTYHHSIIVGNLAEAAAEAVGVNPLLARVSAYYHDIGKIKMPEYFIENQITSISKHDKLAPRMSSLILLSHVKEGVELGRQYNLPKEIIDIIQQHHGSSVQTFFYQKAKESHNAATPLPEEDFRYPGPKPQTRVAALVLMADAVEAASRVLTDTTPARVALLVDRIVNHCFIDGQLDNCELTFKDIREIRSHFVYILTSMYHKRIKYPGFDLNNESTTNKSAKVSSY